jgi:hypothetical protein
MMPDHPIFTHVKSSLLQNNMYQDFLEKKKAMSKNPLVETHALDKNPKGIFLKGEYLKNTSVRDQLTDARHYYERRPDVYSQCKGMKSESELINFAIDHWLNHGYLENGTYWGRHKAGEILPIKDLVNNPPHYTNHPSGIECIDITRHMSFNLGNAIKYIWRCDLKKDAIEDLEKAVFYLNDEIKLRKKK